MSPKCTAYWEPKGWDPCKNPVAWQADDQLAKDAYPFLCKEHYFGLRSSKKYYIPYQEEERPMDQPKVNPLDQTIVVPGQVLSLNDTRGNVIIQVKYPHHDEPKIVAIRPQSLQQPEAGPFLSVGQEVDVKVRISLAEKAVGVQAAPKGTLGPASTGLVTPFTSTVPVPAPRPVIDVDRTVDLDSVDPDLMRPEMPAHYLETPEMREFHGLLYNLSGSGRPAVGGVVGDKGTGKTIGAVAYAAKYGFPWGYVNFGEITDPGQFYGERNFDNNKTGYDLSIIVKTLETPNATLVADEVNRAHGTLLAPFMQLTEHPYRAYIPSIRRWVQVAPGVTIWCTMNVGHKFSGTFDFDAAMASRIRYKLEVGHLPKNQEIEVLVNKTGIDPNMAEQLVEFAEEVRAQAHPDQADPLPDSLSIRDTLAICEAITLGGLRPLRALEFTVLPNFSNEGGDQSPRYRVKQIIQGKFGG